MLLHVETEEKMKSTKEEVKVWSFTCGLVGGVEKQIWPSLTVV